MRMPCRASCMVSMMRVPPVNCMRAMPRTRRISLRRKNKAGGAMMRPASDMIGSCDHHHDGEADQRHQIAADRGDEEIDHLADGGGAGGKPGDEFRRMAVGKKADVLLQQLVEHAPLIVGDDAVADPRQHDGGTVGRKRLDHEDHHRDQAERHDLVVVAVDIGRVDHGAEQIRGQRRGSRRRSPSARRRRRSAASGRAPRRRGGAATAHRSNICRTDVGRGKIHARSVLPRLRSTSAGPAIVAFHARKSRNFQVK